jgi:uncharacterized integral membrane protein (TIGR00698 family)
MSPHPPDRLAVRVPRGTHLAPGVGFAVAVGIVGTVLGARLPVIGAPVIALLVGALAGGVVHRETNALSAGLSFGATQLLQAAIVLLGAQISLGEVAHVGLGSVPVMLVTLTACLSVAALGGRLLRIDPELRTLIGVGTGICGASAIAAISSVTRPRATSIAYAISTIFLFNIVAVLAFPPLGHLLQMSQSDFGLFAGTAVNDTSSVVAASAAYGHDAADHAVVVKLTRTLMIVPIAGFLAMRSGLHAGSRVCRLARLVPWFLIGFLVAATLHSTGLIDTGLGVALGHAAVLLTATALGAIGVLSDTAALRAAGIRPLLLGTILWLTVTATSLLAQTLV